ncbi:uncharacterized protein N7479_009123 [Penicillium vulpinum]|uniref:Uncharacterized protein n=1 Tax=Penicillium vulpinum TaxID=29845 RepID=A0A1V6RW94_9EURO|nr:uncharacterized protein N7479_009123 [Penicillium vulpinum]KAJ5950710.1 hypothetical protein N7479_009123 [Penicillium vulpinum]OQE05858.1 hypothetical protein PENVUL_c021G01411 [Penicillium vulpinum]
MWSKRPFHRPKRPSISGPIMNGNPPTTSDPVHDFSKQLPALPDDLHSSLQPDRDDINKRHSDISPAVSPILEAQRRGSQGSFCVSPIRDGEQFPRYARQETRSSSSPTPIPKVDYVDNTSRSRAQPVQPVQPVQPPQNDQGSRRFISGKPTRWDDFSGEPTSTDAGRASQVYPRSTSFQKPSGPHTSNLLNWGQGFNPKKTLNAARNRISSFSKTEDLSQKEPRSRSSSRVFPVEERSNKRSGNGAVNARSQTDNFGFAPTTVTTITAGGPVSFPRRLVSEHAPSRLPEEETSTFKFDNDFSNMMLTSDEPRSRFSATTYTATDPGSQDGSPRGSMQLQTRSTDDVSTSSIMSRRRPVPISDPISKKPVSAKPVRKPTPSQVAQQVAQMPVQSPSPPPQPEVPLDAQGRIRAMETKRDELDQRRINLETLISELSKIIEPTSVAYDLAAKAEVQKSIKAIEIEIADVKKEWHDLGLKITRAWIRLDQKENAGDGNNLWVKRVTS